MDFFDNVVNKSNAIIKERLNNPFGSKQSTDSQQDSPGVNVTKQEVGRNACHTTSDHTESNQAGAAESAEPDQEEANGTNETSDKNSQLAAIAADAEAVAQKAAKGAQKFGTFLFSMANKAGQTVSQTAKQVKQAVENTSILNDLTREQQEFIREHGGSLQAGELPWANEQDETRSAYIREQVLTLSQDKRNFVRSPPSDSNFVFDPQSCIPVALALLKEDPNLNKMRYELVPKLINEDTFWCNYFYRVSMLKQMSEKGTNAKKDWSSSRSSSSEGPDEVGSVDGLLTENEPFSPRYDTSAPATITSENTSGSMGSSNQHQEQQTGSFSSANTTTMNTDKANRPMQEQTQFQSDEFESNESRKLMAEADDLNSKLRELNIGSFSLDGQDVSDEEKWKAELQHDLREFELITKRDIAALQADTLNGSLDDFKLDMR